MLQGVPAHPRRLDMEVQLQAISRANFALQCNLNWMTLHSHQLQWKWLVCESSCMHLEARTGGLADRI